MRRRRRADPVFVNGWLIDHLPNSFAERFVYELCALAPSGFTVAKHGFQTRKEALKFARSTPLPAGAIAYTTESFLGTTEGSA